MYTLSGFGKVLRALGMFKRVKIEHPRYEYAFFMRRLHPLTWVLVILGVIIIPLWEGLKIIPEIISEIKDTFGEMVWW